MIGFLKLPRRMRVAVAVLVTIGVPAVISLRAADHADSPDTSEGNLDVNDLYVFSQGDEMVFVMTVNPLLTPGAATDGAAFNPEGLYQFKLDATRDGVEDAVIQVVFSGTGPSQMVDVRGPLAPSATGTGGNALVSGASVRGGFNTTFSGNGMTVFTGPRDDPFFIDLFGDMSLTSVLNAAFTGALGEPVGSAAEQTLAFADPGVDDLAGVNVLAIVLQLPKSAIASALGIGQEDTFYAWASTSTRD